MFAEVAYQPCPTCGALGAIAFDDTAVLFCSYRCFQHKEISMPDSDQVPLSLDLAALQSSFNVPDATRCPRAQREGIDRYAKDGIEPGSCLRAILANDLTEAFGRADMEVMDAMRHIVAYVYNSVPRTAIGSHAVVNAWLAYKRATVEHGPSWPGLEKLAARLEQAHEARLQSR